MASIRYVENKNTPWLVDYYVNGKRKRKFFDTKREAQTFKKDLLIGLDGLKDPVSEVKLQDAMDLYFRNVSVHKTKSCGKREGIWLE